MSESRSYATAAHAGVAVNGMGDIRSALEAAGSAGGLLVERSCLGDEFFNLRSGVAGELFQKFTNYQLRLALVVPDLDAHGERFSELAFEHRRHNAIRFFASEDDAAAWLAG
ncbi:MAG TPA: DUF4180 domain-containing protein [Deinococcales bacterium]|nr:DUF4180 domain-containing protein [Deinococcales bacterium]